METKPRILYLQKILLERTDEENPLSTTQLINILNDEYGISAHRTTVTKDIAALQEFEERKRTHAGRTCGSVICVSHCNF